MLLLYSPCTENATRQISPMWKCKSFQISSKVSKATFQDRPGPSVLPRSSVLPVSLGCRWHLAFLILNEAVCFIGGAKVSTDKHSRVGRSTQLETACGWAGSQVADCEKRSNKMPWVANLCSCDCCWCWAGWETSLWRWGCRSWPSSCCPTLRKESQRKLLVVVKQSRVDRDRRRVTHLPGSEPWRRTWGSSSPSSPSCCRWAWPSVTPVREDIWPVLGGTTKTPDETTHSFCTWVKIWILWFKINK